MTKKIFVVGDSISLHYGLYLEKYLSNKFIYDRKGKNAVTGNIDNVSAANGGDSSHLREYLISENPSCDILLINCGLHDIKTTEGKKQVCPEDYRRNLDDIVQNAQKSGQSLIWISSTPVPDERHNSSSVQFQRYDADIRHYNAIAGEIMNLYHIPSIDLYTFTAGFGPEEYCDHIHYSKNLRQLQGAYIAGYLESTCR